MPVHCVSDNGPQFRSEEFTCFLKMSGVKHVRVAPYHAASNGRNGLAERMVQSLKNHMKACKGSKVSIQLRIENFLLTYWSTKHPTTGRSPTSLFLGCKLRTRLSLFVQMWERRSWIPKLSRRQRTMCTRSSESSTQATGSL